MNCLEVLWTESSVATSTEHKLFSYPFSRRSSTTNTRCWTQSFRGHLLHHCAIGDASKLDWHIIWLALFLLQLWFLLFYLLGHLSPLDKTVLVESLTGIRHICLCVVKFCSPHALACNSLPPPPPPIKHIHKKPVGSCLFRETPLIFLFSFPFSYAICYILHFSCRSDRLYYNFVNHQRSFLSEIQIYCWHGHFCRGIPRT